jgi:hypothetical protein
VDTDPSISPAQPRLHEAQHEQPARGLVLRLPRVRRQIGLRQPFGGVLVLALRLRQIAQQLADGSVARPAGRAAIEALCLRFHDLRLLAHRIQPQRPDVPHRAVLDEPAHVAAPDQRDVLAEFLAEQVDQAPPVFAFLRRHFREDRGARREIRTQPVGEVGVDAAVLLLAADRQREHFPLAELVEIPHVPSSLCPTPGEARRTRRAGRWRFKAMLQ